MFSSNKVMEMEVAVPVMTNLNAPCVCNDHLLVEKLHHVDGEQSNPSSNACLRYKMNCHCIGVNYSSNIIGLFTLRNQILSTIYVHVSGHCKLVKPYV